ncbi:cyanophycin synthetase [Ideonella azotifigens]|uniref:Cyanophycin synthetase n=1 Tax=Ideonella azotifigens TaxID=513160 RepID=A0ABP3VHQ0_9BURK|nr:cyanophycin synthetase [Ideonella azotifigens]MCD2342411.1 cyanophycin synthetase [Ideonella azotifigens]
MSEPKNDIQLLRITYLRGPNIWTYRPVMEVWLDLGELEDSPSQTLPGFTERLLKLLPALEEHHCGVGERGGFLQRLTEGTWAGHILEHCVIELLNLAGMPTGFGQTRSTSQRGVYRMVFRARNEQVGRAALQQGHALLMAAINDRPFDTSAAVAVVREAIDDCYLGPSTACIVAAATDRRIPHIRLNDGNLVQLGYGARQRRIWTAETDLTCAIAENIASDKDLTKTLLKACGVPVPEGEVVHSPAEAWSAAEDIGLPVVVKPSDGNHGRGVTLDLSKQADIEAAYEVAARHGSEVLVEPFIRGEEHRLLVVGGKVVAAARGETAWVTGDGQHDVATLVDQQINSDPRRGTTEDHPLNRLNVRSDGVIQLDLQRQGLTPDTVPPVGKRVLVQRNGNVAIDCTDAVHPEVAHVVSLAVRAVGLDIAGVDLVCEDISRPLEAQGGAIVEVNAGPGLLMHLKPAEGTPRPVGQAIVEHLFPAEEHEGHAGRIPIVGVMGTHGTATIARAVAWLIHLSGKPTALACQDGLFIGSRRTEKASPQAARFWEASHRLLMNREAQAAVFENSAALVLDEGLPYDRCHVGLITDFGGAEALGRHDITEADQLYKVLRTQIDVVLGDGVGVLNAGDARIAEMAELCDGEVLMYGVDEGGTLPEPLVEHQAAGKRVAFLRGGRVHLTQGAVELPGVDLAGIVQRRGHAPTPELMELLLAAVAAAWAFGISPDLIAAGIETFALQTAA